MRCGCGSEAFQKFGSYYRDGQRIQRLKCKACDKVASDTANRPLGSLRVPLDQAIKVITMLTEGMGIRGTSRVMGLHQETVLNILAFAGARCEALLKNRIRGVSAVNTEVDELYSYVRTRPENANKYDISEGEIYCYLAISRESKLVISHVVGKRTAANCHVLMRDLRSRLVGHTQLSTDGFPAYSGPAAAVFSAFGNDVSYGTEVKEFGSEPGPAGRYTPAKCLSVKREALIGSPDLSTIGTSRIERMNLSVRHFTKRFTRSTPCFSKTLRNHRHAVRLFLAHFNFCRPHSSLKNGIPRTPAMAAGLTDHVWTVEELLRAE